MSRGAELRARVHELVTIRPDSLFLSDPARAVTFREAADELDRRARQLRHSASGEVILLSGGNSVDWVLTFLAASAADLLVVPLPNEIRSDTRAELSAVVGGACEFNADRGSFEDRPSHHPCGRIPEAASFGLLTSGSTGGPCCCLRSDSSLLDEGQRYRKLLDLGPDDTILVSIPMCHAFALGAGLGTALATGCSLKLRRFHPRKVVAALRQESCTLLPVVAAACRLLCQVIQKQKTPITGVRHVVVGAGPVSDSLESLVVQCFGRRPCRNYGSTETGATLGTAGEPVPSGTTGGTLPGVQVACYGSATSGALFTRVATPFLGHLTRQGVDRSALSPDNWYSTGDVGVTDEHGRVAVQGRIHGGLRRGGRWIWPAEIEEALRSHPDVTDAVVSGSADEDGEHRISAHVEVASCTRLTKHELRGYVAGRLEEYKVPCEWSFHTQLPRTSGGKPDRRRIQELGTRDDVNIPWTAVTALTAHRLTTSVFVARRVGLLQELSRAPLPIDELAARLGLNPTVTRILVDVLEAVSVIQRDSSGLLGLNPDWNGLSDDSWLDLEEALCNTWLSADAVEDVVRNGVEARAFERQGDERFCELYLAALNRQAKLAALTSFRRVRLSDGPVLEIGCPAGAWSDLLRKRSPQRSLVECNLSPGRNGAHRLPPPAAWAAVILHNSIRRLLDNRDFECNVRQLQPDGVVIISDQFTDAPSPVRWLRPALQLDAATHGVVAWETFRSVRDKLTDLGLQTFERIPMGPYFEVVICEKART